MDFEWHGTKAKINLVKHDVSFEEAMTAFYDPCQLAFYDPDNSADESREIMIGHSNRYRLLLVVYTIRNGKIRIISARQATKREANDYAQRI